MIRKVKLDNGNVTFFLVHPQQSGLGKAYDVQGHKYPQRIQELLPTTDSELLSRTILNKSIFDNQLIFQIMQTVDGVFS